MLCKQVSFAILTGLFYPLRISPGRILQGFSVSTGLFFKVYRSLLTLPHTAGGFHYAPAPREASHDGEGGDAKPEMPDGNQDGGHFTQVPESVRVCAFRLSHPPLHSLHLPPLSSSSSLSSPFSRARERTSRMHAPAQTHTDTCGATMCAYPYELYTRIGAGVRRFQCYLRRQERRMPPRRFREQVLTGCGRDNEGCTL